jgi:hypothetical protein
MPALSFFSRKNTAILIFALITALQFGFHLSKGEAKDKDGQVFVDPKRSLKKQEDAAKEAAKVVQKGPGEANAILALLTDPAAPVRDKVVSELSKWTPDNILKLSKGLRTKNSLVIEGLSEVIEEGKVVGAVPSLLIALAYKKSEEAPVAVLRALAACADPTAYKDVAKYYKREKRNFRWRGEALRTLVKLNPGESKATLEEAFKDKLHGVRIMALVLTAELDRKAGVVKATQFLLGSLKARDKIWAPRLLFASLDTLSGLDKREDLKEELSGAIDAMIVLLQKAKGREKHELGLTLKELTGEKNLAPDALSWKTWWTARRAKWEPKDKAKKKSKKAAEEEKSGASVVRFHGIPIFSKRLTFVQDISGGMKNPIGGRGSNTLPKLTVSKTELNKVLKSLSDDAFVNLLYFASYFYKCAPKPVLAKKFRRKLMDYNNQQQIPGTKGHGRSNIYDTVHYGITQPNIDTIYVLTEGGPTEGKFVDRRRFMKHLKRINLYYRVRVHTLLMGSASDGPPFLKALAASTGGEFYDLKKLKK